MPLYACIHLVFQYSFPAILLLIAAAANIHTNIFAGKHKNNSMVTAKGFCIMPPSNDAVTIAAANTTCPSAFPQLSIATPYPIHTPAKIIGKKCPPFNPN